MAAQNSRQPKSNPQRGLGCGIAFGVVFLVVLGAVGYFVVRARLMSDVLTTYLNAPASNQRAEAGQLVNISASAAYPRGVSRVEVYADGALISAQDSRGQGETSLSLNDAWIPPTSGRHVLMARGYASDDLFADSQVVYLDVAEPSANILIDVDNLKRPAGAPNPSLAELATALGTTPEELVRRNPSLGGSDPAAPIPPGLSVEGPRPPDTPRPEPTPIAPVQRRLTAPTGLSGMATCTSVSLHWSASPDAASYRVYRLASMDERRSMVADGLHTTTFQDTLPGPGTYRYQVASVRGSRAEESRMITISSPADCLVAFAPPGTAADLVLTVAMVDTTATWDGVYCYLSVNGRAHDRIPAGDSNILAPEAANTRYYNLTRLPGGGRVMNFTGQPLSSPVTLQGECIGRRGPVSTGLGGFSVSHPQAEWDGTLRSASGTGNTFRFSYCLGPSTRPCTPTIPGASGYVAIYTPIEYYYFPAPTNLRRVLSIEACSDLPTFAEQIDCATSGVRGRQTLFWDWTGNASVSESSLQNYSVSRTVYDQSSGRILSEDFWGYVPRRLDGILPKRSLTGERDLSCDQRVEYRVRAEISNDHYSAWSDPVSFETPPCVAAADVTITFDTLQLSGVVDTGEEYGPFVPAIDADLEIWGGIHANGGTMSPTDYATNGNTGISLNEGTYSWASLDMYYVAPYRTASGRNRNVFRTRISDARQTISFGVLLDDVDTNWTGYSVISHVIFCDTDMTIRAQQSVAVWSRMNETFILTDGSAEGDCTVTVRVVGAPVR